MSAERGRAAKGAERASGKLTNEQKTEMVRRYEAGESTIALGKAFGITPKAVGDNVMRRGKKMRCLSTSHRRLTLDEAAFSEINERSAYWVGFIMADGGINRNVLKVGLSDVDIAHLRKLREFLKAGHTITHRPGLPPKNGKASFTVNSDRIVADLARFGVVPNKSHTARVIGGLEHDRHFWRGVVDGDGSVRFNGYPKFRYPSFELVGSSAMMSQFSAFIETACPGIALRVKPHKNIFRVTASGRTALAILDTLYSGATVALDRKAATAHEMLMGRMETDLLAKTA